MRYAVVIEKATSNYAAYVPTAYPFLRRIAKSNTSKCLRNALHIQSLGSTHFS